MSFRQYKTPNLFEELQATFDVVIGMEQSRQVPKGTSIATYGLGGCIGGYIENPNSATFFHFSPLSIEQLTNTVRNSASRETSKIHFFVPGEWKKDNYEKWKLQPTEYYTQRLLSNAIAYAESLGIECVFHCYRMDHDADNYYDSTAWLNKHGQLFLNGWPVEPSTPPAPPPPAV